MYRVLLRVNKSVLAACFQLFHCKDSSNLSVIHSVGGKINYKLSFCLQLPVVGYRFVSHQHSFAYNLESNRCPKRRFASFRNLFTCHCHPFAPGMVSDCGGYLSGAIVPCREYGGAYAIRPYTDVRQWPPDVRSPPKCFPIAADTCRALLFPAGNMGAYAIRPYTDVRQWPLTFIRPRNVFRRRRMPVGRYCSRP